MGVPDSKWPQSVYLNFFPGYFLVRNADFRQSDLTAEIYRYSMGAKNIPFLGAIDVISLWLTGLEDGLNPYRSVHLRFLFQNDP